MITNTSDTSGITRLGKSLSVSVLNQAVSSGTNFAVGLYLVRVLSPEDFGFWGIGFAICLFFGGIGNSLLLTQMVVLSPEKAPEERPAYAARIFILIAALCAVSTLLALCGMWITVGVVPSLSHYSSLAYATIAASVGYLLKEFFVRHAYNVQREAWALLMHILLASSLAVMFLVHGYFGSDMDVSLALWVYAGGHFVAAFVGFLFSRPPMSTVGWEACREVFLESWMGGRWAILSNISYFLRIHAHTLIVVATLGPAGVGRMNAARLFVTPAIMITPALGQVFLPRMSASRVRGEREFRRTGRLFTAMLLGVAVLYSFTLLSAYDCVYPLVVGDRYADLNWLVGAWCLYACMLSLRNGQDLIVVALKRFRGQLMAYVVSAILALAGVWLLAKSNGVQGAVAGLVFGEFVLIGSVWLVLRRSFKTQPSN